MGKTKPETGDDTDLRKALEICKNLQALKMTPKEFMITFLTSKNSNLVSRRRLWTIDNRHVRSLHLVRCIRDRFEDTAIRVLTQNNQRLEHSSNGHWQSSQTAKPEFFSEAAKIRQESTLIKDKMPFLYGILMGTLEEGVTPNIEEEEDTVNTPGDFLAPSKQAEGKPERAEAEDLSEAPQGPSGTLHPPANIRGTAPGEGRVHFKPLGKDQRKCWQQQFVRSFCLPEITDTMHSSSSIPSDNLDIEEKVHMASVENRTMMLHGTWGYVQLPCKSLLDTLDTLDHSELNMAVYQNAIKDIPTMSINPNLFMPSREAEDHYYSVWTSRITQVMKDYITLPSHSDSASARSHPSWIKSAVKYPQFSC
ncbi:hypothetical protein PSTT_12556 [Puccinia striiformis]|uniref:Uncharacterized protein n=1 Tax=Puccinia striiformis TaxID=27350 RepID=A0A2S4UVT6_9BASI|nr:hypothetical protein PSTT_12556 [Puccinia striiformis]